MEVRTLVQSGLRDLRSMVKSQKGEMGGPILTAYLRE